MEKKEIMQLVHGDWPDSLVETDHYDQDISNDDVQLKVVHSPLCLISPTKILDISKTSIVQLNRLLFLLFIVLLILVSKNTAFWCG